MTGVSIRHFDRSEAEWRNLPSQKYNPHGGEISEAGVFIEADGGILPHAEGVSKPGAL